MFRDVPGCSGMFYVPGFADAQSHSGDQGIRGWMLLNLYKTLNVISGLFIAQSVKRMLSKFA